MAHGFLHDEHGDRSAARLMSLLLTLALIAMAIKIAWTEDEIPDLHWSWIALVLGLYLITKVGQPVADALMKAIAERVAGIQIKPEEPKP